MQIQRNSLLFRYFFLFFIVTGLLLGIYGYVAGEVTELVYQQIRRDLAGTASILEPHLPSVDRSPQEIDTFCKEYAGTDGLRITVIRSDGTVLGDSEYDISMMNNHADRPEIITALRGDEGFSIRYSVTLGIDLAYLAVPVSEYGAITAVFRLSRPVDDIETFIGELDMRIVMLLVFILILSGAFGYYLTYRIRRLFRQIETSLEKVESGEYDIALDISFPAEALPVAEKMNRMAHQLDVSIAEITARNRQLEAILANMVEPVVLLDKDLKIRHMNHAAVRMLDLDPVQSIGKGVLETFRNSALYEFALEVQQGFEALETNIELNKNHQVVYLQVHGTLIQSPLRERDKLIFQDSHSHKEAVLLVFNNITQIKALEKIRQDFVANVSHELKTPITSINGFVETLMQGAIDNRDEALQFLGIIDKQTRRLNSIIDDLLSLSKLENLEHQELEFEDCNIVGIVSAAVQLCLDKARGRNVEIIQKCGTNMQAEVIPLLVEQALVNIIDNAVKYSDTEGKVIITCTESENYIHIAVEDYGRGIPEKDLPRIFERFYRVDKARSRELGGTGLGLSITKHIIRVNKGTIRVTSEAGVGTTFYINLPKHQQN